MSKILTRSNEDSFEMVCLSPRLNDELQPMIINPEIEQLTEFEFVKDFHSLYNRISRPDSDVDAICVDITELYSDQKEDPWNTINAITTILNCQESDAIIVGKVSCSTNPKHIKEFLAFSNRCRNIIATGSGFTEEDISFALNCARRRIPHVPESISSIIFPKKIKDDSPILSLSPRQKQIMDLIVTRGASNKMIARTLNISESTVKLHVSGLFKKFCVTNRTQLALFNS